MRWNFASPSPLPDRERAGVRGILQKFTEQKGKRNG